MNVKFVEINESEYKNYSFKLTFYNPDFDRKTGVISVNGFDYFLGWPSDLMKPEIIQFSDQNLFAFGIDQKFAIIDYSKNEVKINLNLDFLFLKFYCFQNFLVVATELKLLIMKIQTLQIVREGLPDTFSHLNFDNNYIDVSCLNGEHLTIELPSP